MATPPMSGSHFDTPNDHGPLLFSIGWCLAALAVSATGTRLATRWVLVRRFQLDDSLIIASTVFTVAYTITTTTAISNGDGQHQIHITGSRLEAFQKSIYAGQIFYILSLALARISLGELMRLLTPVRRYIRILLSTNVFIGLWAAVGIIVSLFQCHLPDTWRYIDNTCVDWTALVIYIDVMSLVSDAVLFAIPIFILISVQVPKKNKLIMLACFSCRIFVIGATIAHLVLTSRIEGNDDSTFNRWTQTVTAQVTQSLNILTACIPYLRPFYESLQSGMLGSDDLRRRKLSGSRSYEPRGWSKNSSANKYRLDGSGKSSDTYGNTTVTLANLSKSSKRNVETGSQSSQTNFITKIQTFAVEQSERPQGTLPNNSDAIEFALREENVIA